MLRPGEVKRMKHIFNLEIFNLKDFHFEISLKKKKKEGLRGSGEEGKAPFNLTKPEPELFSLITNHE